MTRKFLGAVAVMLLTCATAFAQQTTGVITGRVVDQQGAAVPGVTVTAKSPSTGFTRTETSDAEGVYRLAALPVGIYEVTAELQGFSTVSKKDIEVNVGQTQSVDFPMKVAALAETVNVVGATPLIQTTSSSVGAVVDVKRIESLPLNGRQFANLAATVPGVGLGFHSDPTKSTQYAPQINGGAGRNVNYQIDGGDNNDDTVGGLLQQFPLEAVEQFNFVTQRFKAEYGRSNGGVLNVVTKSGTNTPSGSFFEFFRDKSMNAQTETEKLSDIEKQDYRRNQFGGSFGGPIAKDKAHFFFAAERTQQDTLQAVDTQGLFPNLDGVFTVPYRENILTGKVTANLNAAQYLSVRWGRNNNSQPYGASPNNTQDNWGDSTNTLNSINLNHNWVLGGSRLNEFIFQYADFANNIAARSNAPNQTFLNGVTTGANVNTPQTTEQQKYQFRDDFSWHKTGWGGLGHDFKVGANFINEPRLFITFNTGKGATFYTHIDNNINGPISQVSISDGDSSANIPTKQFGTYVQDDWRATDRLTINLGLRYDIVDGLHFDQSKNPDYVAVVNAAKAGKFNSLPAPVAELMNHFAETPRNDKNNIQPRIGAVYDVRGNGKDIIRAGWGIYTDFGYTNSNALFAASDASGSGFGNVFNVSAPNGIRNPNGTFFTINDPLTNIQSQNQATPLGPGSFPLFGQFVDPLLEMPQQKQANIGWSHELSSDTVISADYINSLGVDLNFRPRVNQRILGTTTRRIAALIAPATFYTNATTTRPATSFGSESTYNALILGLRRRMSKGIDFTAGYTLSKGTSNIGNASDELNTANIQDPNNPFDDPRQFGPNRTTDARHRVNLSATFQFKGGFNVAPIFFFRSALPVDLTDGRDLNLDGDATEIPSQAYRVVSVDRDTGKATIESTGACPTVNCGRGWAQSQLNIRISKVFRLGGRAHVEAIGEVFNLFNALNPSNPTGTNRNVNIASTGAPNPNLLQPTTFSGDFQRPEQRVGQIGFRFAF
jgi:outer membrane receptor protein involved in Fe transport